MSVYLVRFLSKFILLDCIIHKAHFPLPSLVSTSLLSVCMHVYVCPVCIGFYYYACLAMFLIDYLSFYLSLLKSFCDCIRFLLYTSLSFCLSSSPFPCLTYPGPPHSPYSCFPPFQLTVISCHNLIEVFRVPPDHQKNAVGS